MRTIYLLWFFSLVFKFIYSAALPLFNDEAYYWVWSHHLQLSYFDHPPAIAWIFYLGHIFEPFFNAVRWPGIILGHLTLLIWIDLLRPHLESRSLKLLLVALLFYPMTGPGSLVLTPDVPLVFFWSLSTWFFLKALAHPSGCRWFIGLGLSLGLGFSSKYHIVLFPLIVLFFLAHQKKMKLLLNKNLVLTFVFFTIGALPVLLWNYQNDFASFRFQLNHGLGGTSWKPSWTGSYLLAQFLIIFPPVVFICLKPTKSVFMTFLKFMAWGPIFVFFLSSFRGHVEANWTITSMPFFLALAVVNSHRLFWLKACIGFWAFLFCLLSVGLLFPDTLNKYVNLKTTELRQYNELAAVAADYTPLYARSYQMASQLSYKLKRPIYKINNYNRRDFFDERPESIPSEKIYYFAYHPQDGVPAWFAEKGHQVIETIRVNDLQSIAKVIQP